MYHDVIRNSRFRYLSITLHVRYLHAEFATYFILPFYHSTSTITSNQRGGYHRQDREMADLEKRLLTVSSSNLWSERDDDTFSLWDISMKEAYNFLDFANTFHPTIRFTSETQPRNNHENQRAG